MSERRLLYSKEEIRNRIEELAREIDAHYSTIQEPLVLVCVLKGAFMFFADLVRRMETQPELEFVRLSSYGDSTSPGESLCFSKDLEIDIAGRHVLIVEDIVDTGHTVDYLLDVLGQRDPASLKVCAFIHKQSRREVEVPVDFFGFSLERGFVVGYGLDCAEKYRQFGEVFELEE